MGNLKSVTQSLMCENFEVFVKVYTFFRLDKANKPFLLYLIPAKSDNLFMDQT